MAGIFFPHPPPLQRHEPQRQQRQRHVVVPADPAPHLVLPQADLALTLLQRLLHPMPLGVRLHQARQAGPPPRVAQRVPPLRVPARRAAPPPPPPRPAPPPLPLALPPPLQRPHLQRPLLAATHRQRLPARRRLPRRPPLDRLERRPLAVTPPGDFADQRVGR